MRCEVNSPKPIVRCLRVSRLQTCQGQGQGGLVLYGHWRDRPGKIARELEDPEKNTPLPADPGRGQTQEEALQ